MAFFDQFPYTNFHELNLDWLLVQIKGYEDIFKEIKKEWQELWDLMQTFPNELYKFASEYNNRLNKLDAKFQELEYYYKNLNYATPEELMAEVEKLNQLIETNVITLKSDIKLLYSYIDGGWVDQKEYIDKQDAQLKELIDNIYFEPTGEVINPITKKITSVQVALDNIYCTMRFFAFNAREYSYLFWTAEYYDSREMRAYEYDIYAKYLYGKWPWMEPSAMCLKATEYDSLDLTAALFESFNMYVWQYDERSLWYFGNAPLGNNLKYATV